MRFGGWLALLVLFCATAAAVSPEDEYVRVRREALARLSKGKDVAEIERDALATLARIAQEIVGPVKVAGFGETGRSNVKALTATPWGVELDGLVFPRNGDKEGGLLATTEALVREWLAEFGDGKGQRWTKQGLRALTEDAFYSEGVESVRGFDGVLDIALTAPEGADLALAKLGRNGEHTDFAPKPILIVTVVRGRRIYIAFGRLTTPLNDFPDCAAKAAASATQPQRADFWGPFDGEGTDPFETWRTCERKNLQAAPVLAEIRHEAQALAERLARAK